MVPISADRIEDLPALRGLFDFPVAARGCAIPLTGARHHPAEAVLVAGAAERRRAEFLAGRACARSCLDALGYGDAPVLRGERGMPIWPEGAIGSISHSGTIAMAVVAANVTARSIGIDVEQQRAVTDELQDLLFRPEERARLALMPQDGRRAAATLMFSAKEAFYKAQFPIGRVFVDYRDVVVEPSESDFAVTTCIDIKGLGRSGTRFDGRWFAADDHVVTTIAL